MAKASALLRRERLPGRGYIGEALTSRWPFHSHWGSILHCDDDPTVYALGRYFTASDPRHATSALSAAVLSLKNNDTHAKVLGEAVGRAIANLELGTGLCGACPDEAFLNNAIASNCSSTRQGTISTRT